jgi:hypothetical protein
LTFQPHLHIHSRAQPTSTCSHVTKKKPPLAAQPLNSYIHGTLLGVYARHTVHSTINPLHSLHPKNHASLDISALQHNVHLTKKKSSCNITPVLTNPQERSDRHLTPAPLYGISHASDSRRAKKATNIVAKNTPPIYLYMGTVW